MPVADPQHLGRAGEARHQLVVDVAHHDEPREGGALLAAEPERRPEHDRHRLVEVGVGVDDHRVLAAHLRDDPLHMALARHHPGRRLVDRQADGGEIR